VGQELIARVHDSRARLLVLTLLLVAVLSALISVNGGVAALLPVAVVMAMRLRFPPSQLLLPLAFAAHAGSLLTLSGSPVNVVASEFSSEAGGAASAISRLRSWAFRSWWARSRSSCSSVNGSCRGGRPAPARGTSVSTHER
jgi:hypothetical protein